MEALNAPPKDQSQPIEAIGTLETPLDDAAVRAAIASAEANNQDPQSITLNELSAPAPAPVEVPAKFLKPDGEVDVEKIQASTKQLDEAIQKKEEKLKSVEDYLLEYKERENRFRNTPNPEKLAAQVPPSVPVSIDQQQMEEIVRRDYQADPLATTTRLFNLMLEQKFRPIEEREKIESTRQNIQVLASKDPRILREDVFAAVNAKLQADPELWKLKNPHKAAWLDVKEEMRLGEPTSVQAQPSRSSPVLGGGTPPSAPSSSVPSPQNIVSNLNALDLRDKKQETMGDEAIRQMLMGNRG